MTEKSKSNIIKKSRLTLTGNKIPDAVYKILEQKGEERKLTPYVVDLVEKEEMMDKLIESLSILINKVDQLNMKINNIEKNFQGGKTLIQHEVVIEDDVQQGDLEVGENVIGGIEEDIEDVDF